MKNVENVYIVNHEYRRIQTIFVKNVGGEKKIIILINLTIRVTQI